MSETQTTLSAVPRAPGEGSARWWFGGLASIKLTAEDTGGQVSLCEMLYPANYVVPRHVHHREDEIFWVLEGTMIVQVGDDAFTAGPGSMVFAPRGVPHRYLAGPDPVRYLIAYTPGGYEGFIGEVSEPAGALEIPPPQPPPSPEQLAALAALMSERYGCDFVE